MLYFYLDNGSNVCGLEFNYKNGEEEGDSSLKEEKEDKKLEEGEETKQYKMEGLGENGDNNLKGNKYCGICKDFFRLDL